MAVDSDNNSVETLTVDATVTGGTVTFAGGTDLNDSLDINQTVSGIVGGVFFQNLPAVDVGADVNAGAGAIDLPGSATDITGSPTLTGIFAADSLTIGAGDNPVFNGVATVDTLTQSGGSLSGAGTLTINNTLTASGSSIDTSVVLASSFNDTLSAAALNGAGDLTNQGTQLLDNSTINLPFDNQGTLRVPNNSVSDISGAFADTGGAIEVLGTGNITRLTINNGFTNTGTVKVSGGLGVPGELVVAGGPLVNEGGGVIQSTGAPAILDAGLDNRGKLDVDANLTLPNAGGIFASGTGEIDIAAGQTLTIDGGTTQLGSGSTFTGTGILDLIGTNVLDLVSDLTLAGGIALNLGGTTTIQTSVGASLINQSTLILTDDTVSVDLDNQSTLRIPNNSISDVTGTFADNGGTIEVLGTGNITRLTINNGFTNTGTVKVSGGLGVPGELVVAGGPLVNELGGVIQSTGAPAILDAELDNRGRLDVDADLTLPNTGGIFDSSTGEIDVAAGRTLTIDGGTTRLGTGSTFTGTGILDLIGTHIVDLLTDLTLTSGIGLNFGGDVAIQTGTGASLINQSTLTLTDDTIAVDFDNQGTLRIPNSSISDVTGAFADTGGTIEVLGTGSVTRLTINNGFTNTGTIEVSGGLGVPGELVVVGGPLVNEVGGVIQSTGAPAILDAAVTNRGTVDIDTDTSLSNAGKTFSHDGGDLNIAPGSTFTVIGGSFAWNAGSLTGTAASNLTLTGGAALAIGGAGSKALNGLTIAGTNLNLGGTGSLDIQSGTLADAGTTTIANGSSVTVSGGTLDADVLSVDGTLTLSGGTLTSANGTAIGAGGVFNLNRAGIQTMSDAFDNGGTVNVNTPGAVLELTQDGSQNSTFNVASGAELRFSSGAHTFNSDGCIDGAGTTTLAGGSWDGAGNVDLTTALNWSGGSMDGTGTTTAGNGVNITGLVSLNRDLNHVGTSVWSAGSNVSGSRTFTNNGSFTLANGQTFAPSFVNNSSLVKASGARSTFSGGLTNVGVLSGNGEVAVANLINDGTISAGTSPGILDITGDLTLNPTSVINAEIEGTLAGPPTQFDIINVSGTTTLNGTLNVSFPGTFTGSPGNTFDILTYGSLFGGSDFFTFNFPSTHTLSAGDFGLFYQLQILSLIASANPEAGSSFSPIDEIVILDQNLQSLVTSIAIAQQEQALKKALPKAKCQ